MNGLLEWCEKDKFTKVKYCNLLYKMLSIRAIALSHDSESTYFINVFSAPYKRQISMLRFIALRGLRAHKNVAHFQRNIGMEAA